MAFTTLASWGVFVPLFASASIFSLLSQGILAPQSTPATLNSQTVPLLTPATNIDPHPPTGGGGIALVAGSALLPLEGPEGTEATIAERPQSTAISVYIVHEGDTLSGIAEMFDVSVNTIMWANDLKNGTIRPGTELVILPITGVRHTAAKGDTVASIAKKYKGDAEEIARANDLGVGSALAVGTVVIVPDGEISAPASVRATARTTPLRGAGGTSLSGYYGWPVDGGVVTQGLHGCNGIDIGARSGTAVFAAASGSVIIARSGGYNGGYGSYVVVQHDNGTQTLYAHLNRVLTSAGARVAQGATIGAVGSTGKSTGFHLHFEVRGAANPFR